jgi:DNA polymerase I
VTKNDLPFDEVWGFDCEFIAKPGERPDVICAAGRELWSGRSFALWEDQLDQLPSFANALVLTFVGNAECTCLLAKGQPLPTHILDLSAEFRNITNGRLAPEGKGLLGALAYYGLDSIDAKHKDDMRKRIMQGRPFAPEEKPRILKYNLGDASDLLRLLPHMLPHIDLRQALYRGEFVGCLARMEHCGVPIDMSIFPSLADERIWSAMRDAMVPVVDAQYGVFVRNSAGEWSFNHERLEAYLKREGLLDSWPRTETGKLNLTRKTWEDQSRGNPQLENLRQLRHVRDKMRKIKLAVGADGRNRTTLWPFKAKTSRTQPKASQFIFSPAVWTRSLIKPEEGQAVAYVDYSSKEFGIAASISDSHCSPSNAMWELYASGDPYLGFARRVGTVPSWATKATHGDLRERLKVGLLAIQYGASPETLAGRLGISLFEGHEMLGQHHELFVQYWKWSDDWLAQALDTGYMWTCYGWQCCTGITEFNERSIRNWPIQATGAEILRIAIILGTRHGVELLAPVHDAVLIQAPIDRIETDVARVEQIMRRASRIVLNATAEGRHELRTDAKIIRYPDRYADPRGIEIWQWVQARLAERTAGATKRETA